MPKPAIASPDEVLENLTARMREGSVTAAAALARELRAREKKQGHEIDDAIDHILARHE